MKNRNTGIYEKFPSLNRVKRTWKGGTVPVKCLFEGGIIACKRIIKAAIYFEIEML